MSYQKSDVTKSPSSLSTTTTTGTTAITTTSQKTIVNSSSSYSLGGGNDSNEVLPTNVCTEEQLQQLPIECISTINPQRPLQHVHEDGITVSTYSLNPISYSVLFILVVEMLERFSFYSINYTQTSYLTGQYNDLWNAGMDAITASSYVSISIAIAYTAPFIGAILGDSILGEYSTILFGAIVLYWPGLLLIAITTIPHFLHIKTFNHTFLTVGFLILWPIGSGIVKSVVNIFGAKQFHPLLQSSLIEAYYVNFYMCINVGALAGGIIVPLIAQRNVTIAYFLPVIMLSIGICIFIAGSSRFVVTEPTSKNSSAICTKMFASSSSGSGSTSKRISGRQLLLVFVLIVPFCVAYAQMPTTFIIQGTVMTKALGGYIDAAIMYNTDTYAVLVVGYIVGSKLYPALAQRNIKIPTTYKFAIGSTFGCCAMLWALLVDYWIHTEYTKTGNTISVLWQAPAYLCIGIGEIFAISSAYEVAFVASPPDAKVLSSALNIFCIGGIPNVICIGLYHLCEPWFINSRDNTTNISTIDDYSTAHVYKYFWVLFGLCLLGVIINVLPSVKNYVTSIEETSIDILRTPKTPKTPLQFRRASNSDIIGADEEAALLQRKRHEYYNKYGSNRTLYHANSMRAGVSNSDSLGRNNSVKNQQKQNNAIKKTMITKLYQTDHATTTAATPATTKPPTVPREYVTASGKRVTDWKPIIKK